MSQYNDYTVAEISEDDVQSISKLEKSLSDKSQKDIVLIAYQAGQSNINQSAVH
jgi:hypothetical protein